MHIISNLLSTSSSYESIKFNVQTSKWAEETYFCIMNSEKKSTDVHKVSLHPSTQAFNEIYSCLYKKSHLYFSKICLYLSLRFNGLIKTTNHNRLWVVIFKIICTSLTSTEILSPDFHFSFPRTTIILKLMNHVLTAMQKLSEVHIVQASWYTFQAAWTHTTSFSDSSNLLVLLWVFDIQACFALKCCYCKSPPESSKFCLLSSWFPQKALNA